MTGADHEGKRRRCPLCLKGVAMRRREGSVRIESIDTRPTTEPVSPIA